MKKIFLIGDSIRLGYEPLFKEKLAGKAEIFSPAENCQFAQYTLRHLHEWAAAAGSGPEIDVVHWNNGLWDTCRLFGDDCLTPIVEYTAMLRRIHKRIQLLFPRAAVVFALSTAVIEERYTNPGSLYPRRLHFARLVSDFSPRQPTGLLNKFNVDTL